MNQRSEVRSQKSEPATERSAGRPGPQQPRRHADQPQFSSVCAESGRAAGRDGPRSVHRRHAALSASFYSPRVGCCIFAIGILALPLLGARADVLTGTNGERFEGKIIEETSDSVTFQSELAGRLIVPRVRIRDLQRAASTQTPASPPLTNSLTHSLTNLASSSPLGLRPSTRTNLDWQPPTLGRDGLDWIQLKSGEWLNGKFNYVEEKKVDFDSEELEGLSFKLKDVRQIYIGRPMFTKFHDTSEIYGTVSLSNNLVSVIGPQQMVRSRDDLTGITPGGKREISFWSGKLSAGLNIQNGNTKQASFNASAELTRRTPATHFQLDYIGNFGAVEGSQTANNQRVNGVYDIRLGRHWFLRPLLVEYYTDPLANIDIRATVGGGVGYYIFDRDNLEWDVALGPAYQYTRFRTVEAGQPESESTPAGVLQTNFKADITRRLKFIQTYAGTFMSETAGLYSHHIESRWEFEIKRHLDIDASFVWDYLQNPHTESSGVTPLHSDFRLVLGVGVKF